MDLRKPFLSQNYTQFYPFPGSELRHLSFSFAQKQDGRSRHVKDISDEFLGGLCDLTWTCAMPGLNGSADKPVSQTSLD